MHLPYLTMTNIRRFLLVVMAVMAVTSLRANTDEAAKVLDQIIRVNNYWQEHNTP